MPSASRPLRDQVVEDAAHGVPRPRVLVARAGPEVDAVEHERAQREHRGADLLALDDLRRALGALDEVVHEPVDPRRSGRPEQLDLGAREVALAQDPVADGVVDVVVDVRDAVDDADDLALERGRLALARVREDAVANLGGEVEALGDRERLLVVTEPAPEALAQRLVERVLARVAERRVAHVVAEPDRLDEVLVQPQRACHAARDRGRLERVRHAGAEVVAGRVDEDLRLALQAAERLGMDDPVAVALERRAQPALVLGLEPPGGGVRADGERREPLLLVPANPLGEGVRNRSRDLGHGPSVVRRAAVQNPGQSISRACAR